MLVIEKETHTVGSFKMALFETLRLKFPREKLHVFS